MFALAIPGSVSAQVAPGQWTRSQGGAVVDVLDLAAKNAGYAITLREGPARPVYASGFCIAAGDKAACSVRNGNGKTGLIELTPRGTGLHYRSFYDDGATTWEGEFVRSQAWASPAAPAAPRPSASQWTRSQAGAVVDVLDLTPQENDYRITLREGFGKPVYSSGTCTVAGGTVTCNSRNVNGMTGQIVLTIRGDSLHYRSSYEGGRRVWEGDFVRSSVPR